MVMEDDLTLDGGHTGQYKDHVHRNVHLKPIYSINKCHPNKFTKKKYKTVGISDMVNL